MFDYKQRPATDEYREGWDRIFGKEEGNTENEEGKGDPEEWQPRKPRNWGQI